MSALFYGIMPVIEKMRKPEAGFALAFQIKEERRIGIDLIYT